MKAKFFLPLLCAVVVAGCSHSVDQARTESKLASDVVKWLTLHEVESPNVPATNLVQLFHFVKHQYPYGIHAELRQLGRNAGFTNSVSEKYIFFSPRFASPQLEGELVCMSASPFRCGTNHCRIYIARRGSNFLYRVIPEKVAQEIANKAALSTVLPPHFLMPNPPPEAQDVLHPPLSQRYEKFVWNLSETFSQESSMPVRWHLRGVTVLAGLALLAFWFWRRSRR